jgi:putative membrane protein
VSKLATALVVFVALSHVWFLVLESFLWTTAFGQKLFKMTPEQATFSAPLARNQGLYNGFLAAGLLVSFTPLCKDPFGTQVFFLACVIVAGVVGALTAMRSILFLQAVPGAAALAAVWAASRA